MKKVAFSLFVILATQFAQAADLRLNCQVSNLVDDRVFGKDLGLKNSNIVAINQSGSTYQVNVGRAQFATTLGDQITREDNPAYDITGVGIVTRRFPLSIHIHVKPMNGRLQGDLSVEGSTSWENRVIAYLDCPLTR